MDEVIKEFLIESHENLEQVDQDLVALEESPGDREILDRIFRTIHTIKGTCGFLDFGKLERLAHVGESLLDRLRDGILTLTPKMATALLELVDATRQILGDIEGTGREGETEYPELIATLESLQVPTDPSAT